MDGRRCGRLACLNPEGSFVKRGEEGVETRQRGIPAGKGRPKTERRIRERERGRGEARRPSGVVVYLDTDLKRTLGNLTFS